MRLLAGRSHRNLLIVAVLPAALALPWLFPSAYSLVLLNMALMFSVVVLGLNFVYGFGGIFSLAQAAFWGIGAYTSALLTTDAHMSFPVGLLGAVLVTSLFGVILGVPTLKLRSHYLTMATLAFGEAVRLVLMNTERLTHGANGIRGIPPAAFGPLVFDTPERFYYLNLAVVLAAILFTVRFRRSRLGRALEATRDDELAAAATGVDVTYCRVLAFVLSAFLAGVAGSLWAAFSSYISPETFDLFSTIRFVAMLLIGGAGTALGPLVGTVLLTFLPEWLRFLEAYYMAIYGLSIVLMLVFAPKGVVGLVGSLVAGLLQRSVGETGRRALPLGEADRRAGEGSLTGPEQALTPTLSQRERESHSVLSPQSSALSAQPSLLSASGLTIAFGGLVAVRSVDLSVAEGEIRGIISPNGSGKTTLLNLVSGIYRPTAGHLQMAGERVDGCSPSTRVQRGIARTFQNIRLFPRLTVLDNVKVAKYSRTRAGLLGTFLQTGGTVEEERRIEKQALEALAFVGLAGRASDFPGDLPYGQQRLVEIARALATEPRLLLLDEPAAGMSLAEKQRLVRLVRALNRERGITVIVIEHDMRIISGLCHQVTVLNFGEIIAEGTPQEVRDNPSVIEAYLGRRSRVRARTR
ncbi:MAG: branched-chain amino acid ABC transporter ATP-binding protein/permease [Chloroflexi bacterium]|nr:branched-chain amino acid ABC transporter ATP-binding protein/permease [Chloroflexota bacterium]